MRRSTAALGLAVAIGIGAENQGNFEFRSLVVEDQLQSPVDYHLNRPSDEVTSSVANWLDEQRSDGETTTNQTDIGSDTAGTPVAGELALSVVNQLNEDEFHCPDPNASEYPIILIDAQADSQICLGSAQTVQHTGGEASIAFEALINPAATRLEGVNLTEELDSSPRCNEALSALRDFGSFLVGQTELVPEDQQMEVLIMGGRECTDYTPPPRPPVAAY